MRYSAPLLLGLLVLTALLLPWPDDHDAALSPTGAPIVSAGQIEPPTPGDVDCSGELTVFDALLALRFIVAFPPFPDCIDRADKDCDGSVNVFDALSILRQVAGLAALGASPDCLLTLTPTPTPTPTGTISVNRGKGANYLIGDPINICFTANQLALTRVVYVEGDSVLSIDDPLGLGHCHSSTVDSPAGVHTYRLQYWNGSSWGYLDETWIQVKQPPLGTIWVDRGEGASYTIGETITICFALNQLALTRVVNIDGGASSVLSTDDHVDLGHCHSHIVDFPDLAQTYRLQYRSGATWVSLDETWIVVKIIVLQ